ncbi:MAG: S-layer protein domain-containing protein, partial [Candidatus Methanoperedens sp.]|nr:S-layer protein domain-containing protein [Candidatus Methanoperedens sp.]
MDCWSCHQDPDDIMYQAPAHGMKYPQANGTYQMYNKGIPANCTTCHVYNKINTSPNVATRIPVLNHSTDPSAGKKWGNYWNNTSMITACYYCHQDELHNSTPELLGNVSIIKGVNVFKSNDMANSTWCRSCHYDNGSYYRGNLLNPVPPEILNSSGKVPANASDGTQFYNHSEIKNFNDSHCLNCHGAALAGYLITTLNFSHSVSEGGGGANCISCHDINGIGAPLDRRVDASAIKQGMHKNLNRNATSSQSLDAINKACWACHGEGTEPSGHPQRYKNPRKCSNNDCHSLSQSQFDEPMVYSHFQNASLNDNPENSTNYNVTTGETCQICHINSLVRKDANSDLALASHYGSSDDLVDSFNCRYCHLDKDNSEDWADATLINKDRISQIEFNKERNKLKVSEGEKLYLGEGYSLELLEISDKRGDALLQLLDGNEIVDKFLLGTGTRYQYEKEVTIDNATFKTPVITLNITSIFKGQNGGFIQLEGFRKRKLHTEKETTNNTACFACHLYRYSTEKKRYQVIDRESKEPEDVIYYTKVFTDFDAENKSKIYFNDEEYIFTQLKSETGKFISYSAQEKYLKEGETWNISDNYYLKLNEVTTDSAEAWLTLTIDGVVVEEDVVKKGSEFKYTPGIRYRDDSERNVTVFYAKIDSISQGNPNFIILKGVKAISPEIKKTTVNTTLMGYNASWFKISDMFITGRIPENLHAPNLFTDQRNWADCVKCHDSSKELKIANMNAISTQLGKHSRLNSIAPNETILSDNIDRACWACHSEGVEPTIHSPTYIEPRICQSCHVLKEEPAYGAVDIGEEPHASEKDCEKCHYSGSHNLIRFEVSPVIKELELSQTRVRPGDSIKLVAKANAGYLMRIRAAEYFVDNMGENGKGTPLRPFDGTFDSQKEEITAEINTSGLSIGEHIIYVHAMERNNRWGVFYPVSFTVSDNYGVTDRIRDSTNSVILSVFKTKEASGLGIISIAITLIIVYLFIS